MKVYVLSIEHKHGTDAFVYESKDDAKQHVIDYVADWWEDEKDSSFDPEVWGENPGGWKSVERYFGELVDDEWYSIQETDLLTSAGVKRANENVLPVLSDHMAFFVPQAWQSNYAVEVDPEGVQGWTISQGHLDYIRNKAGDRIDDLYKSSEISDMVKDDPAAPPWVWRWSGPFTIRVEKE